MLTVTARVVATVRREPRSMCARRSSHRDGQHHAPVSLGSGCVDCSRGSPHRPIRPVIPTTLAALLFRSSRTIRYDEIPFIREGPGRYTVND